jgi:alpha-beta hydrolase superfamily lysophospholipase
VNGFELAAGVIGAFFASGIATGVFLVAVRPWWRRRDDQRHTDDQDPPTPRADGRPPRWPGG